MDSSSITDILTLGEAKMPSPVQNRAKEANRITFVSDNERVVIDVREHSLVQQVKEGKLRHVFNLPGQEATFFLIPANYAAPW
jgi:hypothetical protein